MKLKTIKVYRSVITVTGTGEFPIDMLRHDSCYPFSEADSHLITKSDRRAIVLVRCSVNDGPATVKRWESFGWAIIGEKPFAT